jgi:hypothetical protein
LRRELLSVPNGLCERPDQIILGELLQQGIGRRSTLTSHALLRREAILQTACKHLHLRTR